MKLFENMVQLAVIEDRKTYSRQILCSAKQLSCLSMSNPACLIYSEHTAFPTTKEFQNQPDLLEKPLGKSV